MSLSLESLGRALIALDELVEHDFDVDAIVTRAAELFQCGVGVRTADGTVRCAGPDSPRVRTRSFADGTEVWLGGNHNTWQLGSGWPFPDEDAVDVVMRRIGIAVRAALARTGQADRTRANDLRTIIASDASDEDRLPALRRLGCSGASRVTVIALAGSPEGIDRVVEQIRTVGAVICRGSEGRVHLVLARNFTNVRRLVFPVGVRCSFTPPQPALRAPESWQAARNALRFTVPSTHDTGPYRRSEAVWVDSSEVGGYAVLAEHLSAEALADVPDVQRMDRLYRDSSPDMLTTLLAVASTDSLREAARTVHLHHNSVTHRVAKAEKVLGFGCTAPYGRARLLLTLTLHRLLESHRAF